MTARRPTRNVTATTATTWRYLPDTQTPTTFGTSADAIAWLEAAFAAHQDARRAQLDAACRRARRSAPTFRPTIMNFEHDLWCLVHQDGVDCLHQMDGVELQTDDAARWPKPHDWHALDDGADR